VIVSMCASEGDGCSRGLEFLLNPTASTWPSPGPVPGHRSGEPGPVSHASLHHRADAAGQPLLQGGGVRGITGGRGDRDTDRPARPVVSRLNIQRRER